MFNGFTCLDNQNFFTLAKKDDEAGRYYTRGYQYKIKMQKKIIDKKKL